MNVDMVRLSSTEVSEPEQVMNRTLALRKFPMLRQYRPGTSCVSVCYGGLGEYVMALKEKCSMYSEVICW